jgi:hypothetical protein
LDERGALKVDVPKEHWDRLFSPVACVVIITTVDREGIVKRRFYDA